MAVPRHRGPRRVQVPRPRRGDDGRAGRAVFSPDRKHAYVSQYSLKGPGQGRPRPTTAPPAARSGTAPSTASTSRRRNGTRSSRWGGSSSSPSRPTGPSRWSRTGATRASPSSTSSGARRCGRSRPTPRRAAPWSLPDNRTAYVTAMYADELYRVDLETGERARETGRKPALVLSPDASHVPHRGPGTISCSSSTRPPARVVREVATGREPRTMAISPDGLALYVVNYYANTVTKFDAETLEEIQTVRGGPEEPDRHYLRAHPRPGVGRELHRGRSTSSTTPPRVMARWSHERPRRRHGLPRIAAPPPPSSTSSPIGRAAALGRQRQPRRRRGEASGSAPSATCS